MTQVLVQQGQSSQGQKSSHGKASLGPLLCWAVVFADIGSSIYYVPGILYSSVGGLAGFFVLLTMIVFVLLTLKYAEVSDRFPEGGGVVSVAAQGIHTWAGALGGMFILVSYFLTAAISCLSAIQYLAVVIPALLPYLVVITVCVLLLLGLLNWVGISESAKVSMIAALVAFGSNIVVLVVVFSNVPFTTMITLFQRAFSESSLTPSSLLVGFAGAFLAFSGLESISQLSPVMKAPRKKVIGLALFLVVITIGFTSPLLTTLSTLLQPEAAHDEVLATQLISLLGGHWGSVLLQQEVAVSASLILIFAGNTAIIGAYHVFLALSRMDFLPSFILKRNKLRNTPHVSIAMATGFPILVLLLVNGQINLLGDMYAFGLLGAFLLTCLGLDIIRVREFRLEKRALRGFKAFWRWLDFWFGVLTTLLVFVAWIVGIFSKLLGTAFGGSVVILGLAVAIANYLKQGKVIILPKPLEHRIPNSIMAVLMEQGEQNEMVIESALQEASVSQPVVFLYLSNRKLERPPRAFEIMDPYLEDKEARGMFLRANKRAREEGIAPHFVYQLATPEKLVHVWRFVQPRDVVLPVMMMKGLPEINPDRLRYEVLPQGKVAHLIKQW